MLSDGATYTCTVYTGGAMGQGGYSTLVYTDWLCWSRGGDPGGQPGGAGGAGGRVPATDPAAQPHRHGRGGQGRVAKLMLHNLNHNT